MNINNKKISIVIPTLNEENGILETISLIPKVKLEKAGYGIQILVVDYNSRDNTVSFAKSAGADILRIHEKGVGIAMYLGFKKADGDIIVTSDGNATYPLNHLPNLIDIFIANNIDFMTTNRLEFLDKKTMSFKNWIGNKILTRTMQILFRIPVHDSQSGMMVFTKNLFYKMQLHPNISLPQEMKIEAYYYLKCKCSEISIDYYLRVGKSKLTTGSNAWKTGISNLWNMCKKRVIR